MTDGIRVNLTDRDMCMVKTPALQPGRLMAMSNKSHLVY